MSTHRLFSTAVAAAFALIAAIPADAKPTGKAKVKPTTVRPSSVKSSSVHGPKTTKIKTVSAPTKVRGAAARRRPSSRPR